MPGSKTIVSNAPVTDDTGTAEAASEKNPLSESPAAKKTSNFMHGLKSFGIGLSAAVAWVGAVGAVCYVGARATARGYKDEGVDMNTMYRNRD